MLREALKNETELGKKAKAFMESGALVPDDLVDAIVAERLARAIAVAVLFWTGIRERFLRPGSFESLFEKNGHEDSEHRS